MRSFVLFSFLLFFFMQEIIAQTDTADTEDDLIHYLTPEPHFPGGRDSLLAFIEKNLRWPAPDFCGSGIEVVRFTVGTDGSLDNITVVRSICDLCDQEAIRLVRSMPKWEPAYQNGVPIPVTINLPIYFRLA